MRSLGLKLVALFLACVVWFVVSAPRRERATERAFAAPLAIASLPRDLVITNQIPDTVSVRLRGRISDLRALSSQNLEVTVDTSRAQAGETTITLRPQAINVPPDVEVISIEPNKLRFHIEPLRQKVVRVRALLIGTPPSGYRVGDPTLVPDQALVSGPASQVKSLEEVATERIIMTGRTDTFTQSAAVVSDSPFVRIIEPLAVQVTVPVLAEVGPPVPATTTPTDQ